MQIRRVLLLVVGIAFAGMAGAWRTAAIADESQQALLVEAGFVLKFPAFVSWPTKGAIEQTGFQVCVVGDTDIEQALREVARHSVLFGAEPRIRRVYGLSQLESCHLLFISRFEEDRLATILGEIAGDPVLTVGNTTGYANKGVMINLFLDGEKVRFEINRSAVESSGLDVSFRLLEAASNVQ